MTETAAAKTETEPDIADTVTATFELETVERVTETAEIETEQNEAETETMAMATKAIESDNQHYIEVEPLDPATTVAGTAVVAAAAVPLSPVRSLGSTL